MGATFTDDDTGPRASSSSSPASVDETNGGVDDDRLERVARYGFMAKGFVYAVIGLLAFRMAFGGGGGEQASKSGALDAIAEQPFGKVLLVATALGLFAYAGYRLLLVYTGPDHETSMPGWFARLSYLTRGLIYGGFGVIALMKVFGGGGGGGSSDGSVKVTKAVLDLPGGKWIVAAAGVFVIAVGIRQLVRAYKVSWKDKMDQLGMQEGEGTITHRLGQVGYTGRGIVYGLVGWFILQSALTYDPEKSGGLDVALREVREASYGSFVLVGIAILLVAYGIFSVQEGRHREF